MFSYSRSILPRKFENMFTLNYQGHSYNTRSLNKFRLPLCRLNIRKFQYNSRVQNIIILFLRNC